MKYALIAMYAAAGVTTSAMMVDIDHHRCVNSAPLVYVISGAFWPLAGAVWTGVELAGNHSGGLCK